MVRNNIKNNYPNLIKVIFKSRERKSHFAILQKNSNYPVYPVGTGPDILNINSSSFAHFLGITLDQNFNWKALFRS